MFPSLTKILSFFSETSEKPLERFFANTFIKSGLLEVVENIIGAPINIVGRGVLQEDSDLWEPLKVATQLKHLGVFESVRHSVGFEDEPLIFNYNASLTFPSDYNAKKKLITGGCSSVSLSSALWRCLGESVERFSSFNVDKYKLRTASISELKSVILNPITVSGFSEQQLNEKFKEHRITNKSVFSWTQGYSLTRRRKTWIPAQLVYGGYKRLPQEPIIRSYVTTGAAAFYGSKEQAVINGILEILERDAFMISWLNKLTLPRINLGEINYQPIEHLYEKIRRYNLEVLVLDMTTNIPIPSMLCIIFDPTGHGSISVSAKTDFVRETAVLEAMEGAIKLRKFIRKIYENEHDKNNLNSFKAPSMPKDLQERALFWMHDKSWEDLEFYREGEVVLLSDNKEYVSPLASSVSEQLKYLVSLLKNSGLEVLFTDITADILEKSQWRAVAVTIPQAAHLWLDERFPSYGCRRIFEVPVLKKIRQNPIIEKNINTTPHPFL